MAIHFNAIVNRISTTIDGGWRVTFDVAQSDAGEMMKLSAIREEALQVTILTPLMALALIKEKQATQEEASR